MRLQGRPQAAGGPAFPVAGWGRKGTNHVQPDKLFLVRICPEKKNLAVTTKKLKAKNCRSDS